jgi:hypothetical protein
MFCRWRGGGRKLLRGGSSEGHGNEFSDSVKVRGLLVPERLCSLELQQAVNIALFTTAPLFVCFDRFSQNLALTSCRWNDFLHAVGGA